MSEPCANCVRLEAERDAALIRVAETWKREDAALEENRRLLFLVNKAEAERDEALRKLAEMTALVCEIGAWNDWRNNSDMAPKVEAVMRENLDES